jgi:molybdopterin-guanine dinucleotide biosynthesis protein A
MEPFDAIVLAGGAGRRLGGVDKATIDIASRQLLDRALDAVSSAQHVVVVGPARTLPVHIAQVSETPPGGGPVAAVAAGLARLESPVVVVLACDMPFVSAEVVDRLVGALGSIGPVGPLGPVDPVDAVGAVGPVGSDPGIRARASGPADKDGAMLVDVDGRQQYLAAAYRASRLRQEISRLGSPDGAAMRHLVRGLTMVELTSDPEVTLDCDTWADVEHSRELLEGR